MYFYLAFLSPSTITEVHVYKANVGVTQHLGIPNLSNYGTSTNVPGFLFSVLFAFGYCWLFRPIHLPLLLIQVLVVRSYVPTYTITLYIKLF